MAYCRARLLLHLELPFGATDMAWVDPTHKRPYFVRSFDYFQQPFYNFADYGYSGRLGERCRQFPGYRDRSPAPTQRRSQMHRINTEREPFVLEMVVELEAVKPMRNDRKQMTLPKNLQIV